jgi:DNA end-binding protein Ku
MAGKFAPAQFHDTYREDVMAVVQRKIKAGQTTLITAPEEEQEAPAKGSNIVDLMALLRASVDQRGARAPAAKAAPRKSAHEPAKKARARA